MVDHIFYRSIHNGCTMLAFDPASRQIAYTTRMYSPEKLEHEMRTVTIDETEWLELVKYGEEAGFYRP